VTDFDSHMTPDRSGLYVHIPFCTSKCAYCAFYSEPVNTQNTHRLMAAIHKELAQTDTRTVSTVYIGGGSPSCLPGSELNNLVSAITGQCPDIVEFTVECNPGQVNRLMLTQLRDLGVNRLSLGVQSFDATELDCLGRNHNAGTIRTVVHQARDAGFKNLSLDLIFAICDSTQTTWRSNMDQAITLNPDHISVYALMLEPGTPLTNAVAQGDHRAIDEATDRAMYEQAIETLTQAGYEQYEISNFARPGFECKHNQGTWENREYVGIGPSAASYDGCQRTQNVSDIQAYIDALASDQNPCQECIPIGPTDRLCETAVLNLRTRHGIDIQRFMQKTGQDPRLLFEGPIQRHKKQGLLTIEQDRIFLTAKALPIADSVLCDFAAL